METNASHGMSNSAQQHAEATAKIVERHDKAKLFFVLFGATFLAGNYWGAEILVYGGWLLFLAGAVNYVAFYLAKCPSCKKLWNIRKDSSPAPPATPSKSLFKRPEKFGAKCANCGVKGKPGAA